MEDLEQVVADFAITKYGRGSVHWVDITHIIDPQNFYARLTRYKELLNHIESTEPAAKVTSVNYQDLVVFNWDNSHGTNKYRRGCIRNIETDGDSFKCDMCCIDYGNIVQAVPLEHIWKCDEIFTKIPPLAINCQLSNCNPIQHTLQNRGFRADSINAFRCYVENETSSMTVLGKLGPKLIVRLINSHPDDIATLMAIATYSEIGRAKDPIKWKPTSIRRDTNFKYKDLELNETLHVIMQSGKSLKEFYVAAISDYKKHLQETEFITFYARREFKLSADDISVGKPVCVKDDVKEIYERGFIKSVNTEDKTATVKLIDWGRDEEYPFDKLKYMSAMCLRRRALVIYCSTESQFWDTDLKKFLTPGFEFIITIKTLGKEFESPNTVDIFPLDDRFEGATSLLDDI